MQKKGFMACIYIQLPNEFFPMRNVVSMKIKEWLYVHSPTKSKAFSKCLKLVGFARGVQTLIFSHGCWDKVRSGPVGS